MAYLEDVHDIVQHHVAAQELLANDKSVSRSEDSSEACGRDNDLPHLNADSTHCTEPHLRAEKTSIAKVFGLGSDASGLLDFLELDQDGRVFTVSLGVEIREDVDALVPAVICLVLSARLRSNARCRGKWREALRLASHRGDSGKKNMAPPRTKPGTACTPHAMRNAAGPETETEQP